METTDSRQETLPKLLTLKQVASLLNFSVKTIRNWATLRKLPGLVKINGEWRVNESKLVKAYFLR